MSLRSKTIVITRPPDQAAEMVSEITGRGGRAVVIPMIEIAPPASWSGCDSALDHLGSYDAIAFTSANGVRAFFGRCRTRGVTKSLLDTCTLYAVGPQTRNAVAEEGYTAQALPAGYSAQGLAAYLTGRGVRRQKFLLPRGEAARDELPLALEEAGAIVEAVAVYRTRLPAGRGRELAELFDSGTCDVITFASPSAVQNCAALLAPLTLDAVRLRTAIAVIGPTTERALRAEGTEPDIVAPEATGRDLVDAIEAYFVRQRA